MFVSPIEDFNMLLQINVNGLNEWYTANYSSLNINKCYVRFNKMAHQFVFITVCQLKD